jgi:sucrose phosphorylase
VLDTHDGIGIIDIGSAAADRAAHPGLVPDEELSRLVDWIHDNSRGQSREATGAAASNLDLYQVNCTFFDALGADERAYLLARAIQFFVPGIPQVYYVGLLAGANDMDLLRRTRVGRDINRHRCAQGEAQRELDRPVVQTLVALIRWRNAHPAFGGHFSLQASDAQTLSMRWTQGDAFAELSVDFSSQAFTLRCSGEQPAPSLAVERAGALPRA